MDGTKHPAGNRGVFLVSQGFSGSPSSAAGLWIIDDRDPDAEMNEESGARQAVRVYMRGGVNPGFARALATPLPMGPYSSTIVAVPVATPASLKWVSAASPR
nr:hypothetical protein CPGR_02197 [Mycolicibacterium komanii]